MRNGKLNKREMATLNKAWEILSRWTEGEEEAGRDDTYEYDNAMAAVTGLCELITSVEGTQFPTVEA